MPTSASNHQHQRPDPDELLSRLAPQENVPRKGKLKIFFGSCPGVGKTYAMLLAAHERLKEGIDVVAGIVETHKRPETEKLLHDLTILPPLVVSHRGITLRELDIDAAKKRKPAILLVDELAHTNAPNSRHPKRWNDVEELLDSGIDVYTTLNVQHIESLSDVVAGTTGIWVKETVPDSVFDTAEDIILVDINVDELLKRLHEGKVYISPDIRQRAKENFFRERNLIALREIALRRTAECVDAQMHALNPSQDTTNILPVADRIMVCIGPDILSAQLVRAAKRMASSLKAPWVAVYIENLRHYRLNKQSRQAVHRVAQMAERMGGQTASIQGDNVVDDIIDYAKANRISKIIIGKPIKSFWKSTLYGSLADKVIRKSDYIDVYVITGKPNAQEPVLGKSDWALFRPKLYLWSLLTVLALTTFGALLGPIITPIDQALIFLTGIVFVAAKFGRGPSFFYSLLSVSCFNFFFVAPLYSFNVYDRSYWLTFAVMIITGLVITSQASRLRLQAVFARKRERDTQTFYALTRALASTRGHHDISDVAIKHMAEMFDIHPMVALPDQRGQIQATDGIFPIESHVKEIGVQQWCFDHGQMAGRHTSAMPSASGLYFPLVAGSATLGVLGIIPKNVEREFSGDEMASLETCASLLASALERVNIADIAEKSKIQAESEKLRTMLLSSVSHDLRTPLASITGASSTIVTDIDQLPRETIRELGQSIQKESERLSHLVTNLLEVTRLESGTVQLNKQPYFIEELIGSALERLESALSKHTIVPQCDEALPLVVVDGVLIEQVLINLLENALRYTPEGSTISISALSRDKYILISVADNGHGIPVGNEKKIFDKFFTVSQKDVPKGTGLGLAICASIVKAHHGEIWVDNCPGGGACFNFTLPTTVDSKDSHHDPNG
jgi:two-component system, OmpR family, sensor histidine kinase KdpD